MKTAYLVSALLLCLPASSQNASMFRGNPQHTGIYETTGLPKFSKIKWKFHTEGQVISSPAIVDGAAYVGSTDGNLYSLDIKSGIQKWKFKTEARITSSPAVSGGLVFFGSYDGSFYAVDTTTGKLKWKFQTAGERRFAGKHLHGSLPAGEIMPDPFDFYLSSPVMWSGTVYFGSGDGNIYALQADSGALQWKFKTGDVVHASPAISESTLFVGSWDSYFYAIDATSGKEKWRFKTGDDPDAHNQVGIQSSALVSGGMVYFGCRDSNLYALETATGEKKWAYNNKGSWVIGSPTTQNGKVYFTTSDSGLFHALDAKSGGEVFSLKFSWPMFSSPAIAGNTLYLGTHDGKLVAIDLATQKLAWIFQTDGSREYSAVYTKPDGSPNYETVFTENFYDNMVAGVSKMLALGTVLSSPVIVEDVVYFGSTDGNLYALM